MLDQVMGVCLRSCRPVLHFSSLYTAFIALLSELRGHLGHRINVASEL